MISFPTIEGVSHSFIKVNDTQLHVAQTGTGKPLLLIHGWPQHWYVWRKIIPLLKNHYRLIMPDLPGLGWSDMPKDKDFRKEKLADDMIQLVKALKLKHVDLVGHDWGGWIGFLACLKNPEMFEKYVALGITYPFGVTRLPIMQYGRFSYQIPLALPFIGEYALRFFPTFTEWLIKLGAGKKDIWTKEELYWFSSVLQNSQKAQASSLLYRNFLTKELVPLYKGKYKQKNFRTQTLLLIGENDPVINPSLFQNFNQATVHIKEIKNSGHFIPEEQPEITAKEIETFFK